jgi:hypothetical protein
MLEGTAEVFVGLGSVVFKVWREFLLHRYLHAHFSLHCVCFMEDLTLTTSSSALVCHHHHSSLAHRILFSFYIISEDLTEAYQKRRRNLE